MQASAPIPESRAVPQDDRHVTAPLGAGAMAIAVLRVTSGNFLEMFDFFLFGFYAKPIGDAFFPGGDPAVRLIFAFLTFAAAFLMLNAFGFAVLVAAHGAGDVADPGQLLPLVGAVIAGHVAGALAFRLIDAETFRRVVLALVIAAGVASAVAGLLAL